MNAEELNFIALESSKREFEQIILSLKDAALKGEMHIELNNLTEGTVTLLNKNGFQVWGPRRSLFGRKKYIIGFNKGRL